MNTNAIIATRDHMHKHLGFIVTFVSSAILVIGLSLGFTQMASAQTTVITGQAGPGSSGTHVRSIQSYLATNPTFYPQGLVTGYFGSLTQAAVQKFQAFYGIVSSGSPATTGYGRVGPATLAKMNALIGGGTVSTGDVSGPSFYNATQTQNSNSATFSFNTNENTMARVVYGTSPVMFNEGDVNSNGFGPIGGFSASSANGMSTSHSITIPALQSNTTYYYTIIATDASGNASVWGTNTVFRTTN